MITFVSSFVNCEGNATLNDVAGKKLEAITVHVLLLLLLLLLIIIVIATTSSSSSSR